MLLLANTLKISLTVRTDCGGRRSRPPPSCRSTFLQGAKPPFCAVRQDGTEHRKEKMKNMSYLRYFLVTLGQLRGLPIGQLRS